MTSTPTHFSSRFKAILASRASIKTAWAAGVAPLRASLHVRLLPPSRVSSPRSTIPILISATSCYRGTYGRTKIYLSFSTWIGARATRSVQASLVSRTTNVAASRHNTVSSCLTSMSLCYCTPSARSPRTSRSWSTIAVIRQNGTASSPVMRASAAFVPSWCTSWPRPVPRNSVCRTRSRARILGLAVICFRHVRMFPVHAKFDVSMIFK